MQKNEIVLAYGNDITVMTRMILEECRLCEQIGEKDKKIGIKPNLVSPSPASGGATTHPEVARELVRYLRESGFSDILILEGSGVGKSTARAFEVCGYAELARAFGLPLLDTKKDAYMHLPLPGGAGESEMELSKTAMELDFIINLPVLKGHCQTLLTCALKNMKGLLSDAEKRRFHTQGLHRPIALLNTLVRGDFILVDAICGDLDYEEGGNPVDTGMLFAARDPVLCDAFAAERLGYAPEEIGYIPLAAQAGVGSMDLSTLRLRELNAGRDGAPAAQPSGKARDLARYTRADAACSSCYSALIRALARLPQRQLDALPGPVCIGQGFAGKQGTLGVGRCTAGFAHSVAGCPPSAAAVLDALRAESGG